MSLQDALNPNIVPYVSPRVQHAYTPPAKPQQSAVHRSELELAILEPPQRPIPAPAQPTSAHAVQTLLRFVASTKEDQESEKQRRIAWEKEQEHKTFRIEQELIESRRQLSTLRAAQVHATAVQHNTPVVEAYPASGSQTWSSFVQGSTSSTQPSIPDIHNYHDSGFEPSISSFLDVSGTSKRKRSQPEMSPEYDEEAEMSSESNRSSSSRRPRKRSGQAGSPVTNIQRAMKNHLLVMLGVEDDKSLPPSHNEDLVLSDSELVRFVWAKTAKQSVHNSKMKIRVLEDVKAKRNTLYKHVPDREFSKKTLDSTFDQCFTALREKFRQQNDSKSALSHQSRLNHKAGKSRRISRRKLKLTARANARMQMSIFQHVTFDGAFQIECMSSEESDFEDGDEASSSSTVFRTRGYAWRSSRLRRLYETLDIEERKIERLKRGKGKRGRITGPPKEEFILPPKGISLWMISKSWWRSSQVTHPDLSVVLEKLIADPPSFDWDAFAALGEESDDLSYEDA